jgi:hypothetical protein
MSDSAILPPPADPDGSPESLREWAGYWARRGLNVFPLREGRKEPEREGWQIIATSDPAKVYEMWTNTAVRGGSDAIGYNIGYSTSGLFAIDIDVKDDPIAIAKYQDELYGEFDTMQVQTASGGIHLVYANPAMDRGNRTRVEKLPIDIRAEGGFLVAPGSVINGRCYRLIDPRPPAPVPRHLWSLSSRPGEHKTNTVPIEHLDKPGAIEHCVKIARNTPAIIAPGRGAACFKLAAELHDHGVSEETAIGIILEHWAPRCEPPYLEQESTASDGSAGEGVRFNTRNGYRYAQNAAGSKSPEALLGGVRPQIPPDSPGTPVFTSQGGVMVDGVETYYPPPVQAPNAAPPYVFELGDGVGYGNLIPPNLLKPREWVIHRMLIKGEVTALIAPGGVGKSQIGIMMAIALARGVDFLTFRNPMAGTPQRTIIYNAEDSLQEMSMRLYAQCIVDEIDPASVAPYIMLISGKEENAQFRIALGSRDVLQYNEAAAEVIATRAGDFGAQLAILDPLAKIHTTSESDNGLMSQVMVLLERFARKLGAAILLLHHASKASGAAGLAGNVDASRGASAIKDSARAAFTLSPPLPADVAALAIPARKVMRYLRLDDAKMNRGLMSAAPVWMEKHSVTLPATGEEIGAFSYVAMEEVSMDRLRGIADILVGEIQARDMGKDGHKEMGMDLAIQLWKAADPSAALMDEKAMKLTFTRNFHDETIYPHEGPAITLIKPKNVWIFRLFNAPVAAAGTLLPPPSISATPGLIPPPPPTPGRLLH